MKRNLMILIFLLLPSIGFSMDSKLFSKMIQNLRSEKFQDVKEFLDTTSKEYEKDADYYILLLNYSFKTGYKNILYIARGKAQEGDLVLKNQKTDDEGFIREQIQLNEELIIDSIRETQKALKYFNNRLDIHLGIAYIAANIKKWDIVGSQLFEVLDISKKISNKWIWGTINTMGDNPKEFMIEDIQAKINNLFYVDSPEADKALIKVSKKLIKEYPENIYGYTNLGILYMVKKEYKLSEEYLLKALEINPNDFIVKGNYQKLKAMKK